MNDRAVFALTSEGAALAQRIAAALPADLHLPAYLAEEVRAEGFLSLAEASAEAFHRYRGLVFVAAAGIVVRIIAPLLQGKDRDPAVVVLDQAGRFAVSLISGHLGGANCLAEETARLIGAQPVITTASDTAGLTALDVLAVQRDLTVANPVALRSVNMALLEGRILQVLDPEDRLGLRGSPPAGYRVELLERTSQWRTGEPGVLVSWREAVPLDPKRCLVLHPRVLVVGLGCHRGTPAADILELIRTVFQDSQLSLKSITCLCTTSKRSQEPGLTEAAASLGLPLISIPHEELRHIRVPHPSDMVKKHVGVDSVCEAAALFRSQGGRLLVPKTKGRTATAAVALAS